jgi:hypothetical protein
MGIYIFRYVSKDEAVIASIYSVRAHNRQERSTSLRHHDTLHITCRRPTKIKEWISFKLKKNDRRRRLKKYIRSAFIRSYRLTSFSGL